jgi:hypothetical protein
MKLLPVIAHIGKQHDKIKRLVEHCRRLDGTELAVIPVGPEIARLPYPAGAERVRHEVMRQFRNQAFLWLEVDSVPFRPGWLDALTNEYAAAVKAGKLFVLPSLVGAPGCDVTSGIGVYPPDALSIIPHSFHRQAWDGWCYQHMSHAIHFSRTIQHSYCHCENGKPVRKHVFPQDASILRDDAMVFHADPSQSLISADIKNVISSIDSQSITKQFYHSGDFGDIIAALPVIRHLGGGELYLGPHLHAGRGPREGINRPRFDVIAPLLRQQSYLAKVEYSDAPPAEAIDFSSFRNLEQLTAENLTAWQGRHVGADDVDMSPWLNVSAPRIERVVVSRSLRYHTEGFPWKQILRKHGQKLVFIGLPEEHHAFEAAVGRIDYFRTADLLEVAKIIAGAKFGFYNQSVAFWIAAGLGKMSIQETCLSELNSIVARAGMLYTSTPNELQHIVECSR